MTLVRFLNVCKQSCELVTPFVKQVYGINLAALNNASTTPKVAKVKPDKTAFTIADGIVQHFLINIIFGQSKNPNLFQAIVGEEANVVNISTAPYTVDELQVPEQLYEIIDKTKKQLEAVSKEMHGLLLENKSLFSELTLFIDPIDGTKQFVKGQGEMCAIMIGVVRAHRPVAGIIYRPLTDSPTYAMGCLEEKFFELEKDDPSAVLEKFGADKLKKESVIMLRSATSHSKFLDIAAEKLEATVIRVSGAGNKVVKLIEVAEKTGCQIFYIQDRGISRWDSCAGEAILEAYGGGFYKLSGILKYKGDVSDWRELHYTYRKVAEGELIEEDVDLSIGVKITNTNTKDLSILETGKVKHFSEETKHLLPSYSNLCGLFASAHTTPDILQNNSDVLREAAAESSPDYT